MWLPATRSAAKSKTVVFQACRRALGEVSPERPWLPPAQPLSPGHLSIQPLQQTPRNELQEDGSRGEHFVESCQGLGEHWWPEGGGAEQSGARGGQACPTSSPCRPQVLKGLCHKHLITLYQGMETSMGFYLLGEHPGAGAEPRALLPGPGRALVLPAVPHPCLPAEQSRCPPVGEDKGMGFPL